MITQIINVYGCHVFVTIEQNHPKKNLKYYE